MSNVIQTEEAKVDPTLDIIARTSGKENFQDLLESLLESDTTLEIMIPSYIKTTSFFSTMKENNLSLEENEDKIIIKKK